MCLLFFRIIYLFLVDHCSVFEFSLVVDWHILCNRLCSLNLWHEHCSTWQCAWVALTFRKRPWNCWHRSQFKKREGRALRAPDQSSRRRSSRPPKVREMMKFLLFSFLVGGKGGVKKCIHVFFNILCFSPFSRCIWKKSEKIHENLCN